MSSANMSMREREVGVEKRIIKHKAQIILYKKYI